MKDINYITSFNLLPAVGLLKDKNFDPPPSLRLLWDGTTHSDETRASIVTVDFTSNEEAAETLQQWSTQGLIWFAEPNRLSPTAGQLQKSMGQYKPIYENLEKTSPWWKSIHLSQAFQKLSDNKISIDFSPVVAVLDSGTDIEHASLKGNIWDNTNHQNESGCQDDKAGCNVTQSKKGTLGDGMVNPATTSGYSQPCTADGVCRHGTHVAGIIAAEPNDTYGGVCPFCKIVTVKIVGKTANGNGADDKIADSSIIAGLSYVSRLSQTGNEAVRLVNASFGKFQRSRTVGLLIRLLSKKEKGILVVAAAGNEDTDKREYPAAYDDVLAVANVESGSLIKHASSNYGRWVDISAPGSGPCAENPQNGGILSSVPGGSAQCLVGTSMAAPVVTAVAALVLAANPDMGIEDLRRRLLQTARPDLYHLPGNPNEPYYPRPSGEKQHLALLGQGVVDAAGAIDGTPVEGQPSTTLTKRVTAECGSIGGRYRHQPQRFSLHLLALFLLPLAPLVRQRFTQDCKGRRLQR